LRGCFGRGIEPPHPKAKQPAFPTKSFRTHHRLTICLRLWRTKNPFGQTTALIDGPNPKAWSGYVDIPAFTVLPRHILLSAPYRTIENTITEPLLRRSKLRRDQTWSRERMPPIRETGAMIGRMVKSNLFFHLTRRDRCQIEPRAWLRSLFEQGPRPGNRRGMFARHPSLEGAGRFSPRMLIRHPSVPADLTMSALGPVVKPTPSSIRPPMLHTPAKASALRPSRQRLLTAVAIPFRESEDTLQPSWAFRLSPAS